MIDRHRMTRSSSNAHDSEVSMQVAGSDEYQNCRIDGQ